MTAPHHGEPRVVSRFPPLQGSIAVSFHGCLIGHSRWLLAIQSRASLLFFPFGCVRILSNPAGGWCEAFAPLASKALHQGSPVNVAGQVWPRCRRRYRHGRASPVPVTYGRSPERRLTPGRHPRKAQRFRQIRGVPIRWRAYESPLSLPRVRVVTAALAGLLCWPRHGVEPRQRPRGSSSRLPAPTPRPSTADRRASRPPAPSGMARLRHPPPSPPR